ncbi:DUF305 domain-containing protein [Actinomycetospora sp. OC33-EN08]|uniref:DUF305 domain-containing protein n=1 Tax=Actinomycetospora aurantiaca TaxID=3129233 RepID=A0ABU8MIR2_9PSEU
MNNRVLGGLVAATALVAGLAGCSGPGIPAAAPPASTAGAVADGSHNAADVAFVQGMIPHHQQAIMMSDLVATRSASPEITQLAASISGAQGPEIEQMTRMLSTWGVAPGGSMSGMSGMMGPQQMQQLQTLAGPAFDRAWLGMMIEHHTGAVEMSRVELAQGQDSGARALATDIVTSQQAEIGQMQTLLGQG